MTEQLLFDAGQLKMIVIVAACVLVALAFLYGVIKKFSRMSWLGWQTTLLFAATLPLGFLPETQKGTLLFCLAAGGLLAVTALIFLIGAVLRTPFLALEYLANQPNEPGNTLQRDCQPRRPIIAGYQPF